VDEVSHMYCRRDNHAKVLDYLRSAYFPAKQKATGFREAPLENVPTRILSLPLARYVHTLRRVVKRVNYQWNRRTNEMLE
jgi:hypothetical protein